MEDTEATYSTLLPPGEWRVDPSRSRIGFAVRKLGVGTVRGRFDEATGVVAVAGGAATAHGTVRVASIATGNDDRDAHLLAPAFFSAAAYPEITFRANRSEALADGRWRMGGELTIRDRTRAVEFIASRRAPARLRVDGEIDRRDFGLTWSRAIEATGAVGETIRLEFDLGLERA